MSIDMAIGSMNVSNNSKIENDILDLQNKDTEISNKLGTTDISSIGDGTITGAISTLKSYEDAKIINKRIFKSSPPSTGPITLPSDNATYILSLYNTYTDARHFWIGICLVWNNKIFGIKKLIASDTGWDTDMTLTYTGLDITTSIEINYATITKIGHWGDLV